MKFLPSAYFHDHSPAFVCQAKAGKSACIPPLPSFFSLVVRRYQPEEAEGLSRVQYVPGARSLNPNKQANQYKMSWACFLRYRGRGLTEICVVLKKLGDCANQQ